MFVFGVWIEIFDTIKANEIHLLAFNSFVICTKQTKLIHGWDWTLVLRDQP